MKDNDKINVSNYLKDLTDLAKEAHIYKGLAKEHVITLTCKELAKRCEVTPATISNLTTSSKYSLLWKIASEILDAYYGYFMLDENIARKENPDERIYPRDINYVLMYLTNYYTDEWLNG